MNKKIKIIFFHPYSNLGGADKSLFRLIKNLNKKLYAISFISFNKSFLKHKLNKVNFINLNTKRSIFSIFKIREAIKKIIKKNFNKKIIIFSNQNFANIIIYLSCININNLKFIFVERNHIKELFFYKNFITFIKNLIIYILIKIIYKKVHLIVGISKKLSIDLSKIIGKKVLTIYNPAYDKEIYKLAQEKISFKFKKKFKYIICVSRFTKRKGIGDIILAFNQAIKKISDLKLLLVGYGEQLSNIRKIIDNLKLTKNIKIFHKVNNPYPYIKNSDLFILNSKYEGFANVLVESIILNTPVVSTNCLSGPSEILLNGKGGRLIKVNNNIKEITNAIIEHFNNPKILKNKLSFAKKKLNRFALINNIKLFDKIFKEI